MDVARARSIKPSILDNEVLGTADPLLTILFISTWMLADREGRLEDRPKRIKVKTFPYRDDVDIDAMLTWLHENKFIERYEVDGDKCIQVIEFLKHQNPHRREAPSTIKARPRTVLGHGEPRPKPGRARLTPPSLTPSSSALVSFDGFPDFWDVWPKKTAKADAIKAWEKLKPDESLFKIIVADVRARRLTKDWLNENGRYIPNPATYLNGRRWEDEGVSLPSASEKSRIIDPEVAARFANAEQQRKDSEQFERERAERLAAENNTTTGDDAAAF